MTELSAKSIIELIEQHGLEGRNRIEGTQDPALTARLCDALGSASKPETRAIVCNIFATLADPAALPCLLGALSDSDEQVIAAAADAIGNSSYQREVPDSLRSQLGTRLLELAVDTTRPGSRAAAIYGLGLLGFAPALRPLLPLLEDSEPMIRWSTAEALAHIGDPAAEPYLRQRRRREEDERVRRRLTDALDLFAEGRGDQSN